MTLDSKIIKVRYSLVDRLDIELEDCSSCLNDEQKLSLIHSLSDINVEYEVQLPWGFCRPISINGHQVS